MVVKLPLAPIPEKNPRYCTAKSKRSGVQCKHYPMVGKHVCHIHGGKSLSGIASATYKGKGTGKYLPKRLLESYEFLSNDPNYLELREHIAVAGSLFVDLLQKLSNVDTVEGTRTCIHICHSILAALNKEDYSTIPTLIYSMLPILEGKLSDYSIRDDIQKQQELIRKLVDTERKRIESAQHSITSEQAYLLVDKLADIVVTNIQDKQVLTLIQTELSKLTGSIKK